MAIITDLQIQKRDQDRVSVFLDGQFAFGLTAPVAAGLKIGQELSHEDIERLQGQDLLEKAKKNALGFVAMRPRSEFEVRTHLSRKSYEPAVVDEVMAYLASLDFIDDVAFAEYWVEQRETFRPRSRLALGQELRQKGVNREIIEIALSNVDETAAARHAAEKQASQWPGLSESDFRRKMTGFLQRRGFSYEITKETVDTTWQALQEDE